MPINVPLCFLALVDMESEPLLADLVRSGCESLPPGLELLSRLPDGGVESNEASSPLRGRGGAPSLKTCTVSVAEETHKREDIALKDMLYIREGIEPRRN